MSAISECRHFSGASGGLGAWRQLGRTTTGRTGFCSEVHVALPHSLAVRQSPEEATEIAINL